MNKQRSWNKPRGAVSVFVGVGLTVILVVSAFAVDLGNLFVSRSELRTSADAGALAGAGRLVKDGALEWSSAKLVAEGVGQRNISGSGIAPNIDVAVGYWDTTTKTMEPSTIVPNVNHFPGVRVIAARSASNSNAVPAFFSKVIGFDSFDMDASAIAVIGGPGSVDQRDLFPFVLTKCMYEKYWNYGSTPPGPVLGSDGKPLTFDLTGNDNDYGACADGSTARMAWTGLGFGSNSSSVMEIVDRYKRSNPIPSERFEIGEGIPIFGSPSSPFKEVKECASLTGDGRCAQVTVVVVDSIPRSANGEKRTIRAFSCLEILEGKNTGNPKHVRVRMATSCPPPPSSGGIGPIFGTVTPPALVQ